MLKNTDNNQIVSFRLIRSEDGTFKITKREAMNRTKRMVAFDKGLNWDEVAVEQNLEDDLGYIEDKKKDLGGLIKNIFFRDVNVIIDSEDLMKAATVRDLYEMIWSNCIMLDEIDTQRKTRSIRKSLKITKKETLRITIQMIADDKRGSNINKVDPDDDLKDDQMYTEQEKKNLKGWVEDDLYFGKYNADADKNDLVKATTVKDLSNRIYDKYIPEGNKK